MYYFYFRLLMPSMVRVLPKLVLTRRWCLKRNKSLWILKQMERCWRMDGQFIQIPTLGWVSLAYMLTPWSFIHFGSNVSHLADHKKPSWPLCAWWSCAFLPAVCGMDWTAGAASATGAQSKATGSKGAQQLLLDETSSTATKTTKLVIWTCMYF